MLRGHFGDIFTVRNDRWIRRICNLTMDNVYNRDAERLQLFTVFKGAGHYGVCTPVFNFWNASFQAARFSIKDPRAVCAGIPSHAV